MPENNIISISAIRDSKTKLKLTDIDSVSEGHSLNTELRNVFVDIGYIIAANLIISFKKLYKTEVSSDLSELDTSSLVISHQDGLSYVEGVVTITISVFNLPTGVEADSRLISQEFETNTLETELDKHNPDIITSVELVSHLVERQAILLKIGIKIPVGMFNKSVSRTIDSFVEISREYGLYSLDVAAKMELAVIKDKELSELLYQFNSAKRAYETALANAEKTRLATTGIMGDKLYRAKEKLSRFPKESNYYDLSNVIQMKAEVHTQPVSGEGILGTMTNDTERLARIFNCDAEAILEQIKPDANNKVKNKRLQERRTSRDQRVVRAARAALNLEHIYGSSGTAVRNHLAGERIIMSPDEPISDIYQESTAPLYTAADFSNMVESITNVAQATMSREYAARINDPALRRSRWTDAIGYMSREVTTPPVTIVDPDTGINIFDPSNTSTLI